MRLMSVSGRRRITGAGITGMHIHNAKPRAARPAAPFSP
jgi:hypothetical protein